MDGFDMNHVAQHLLKIRGIINASTQELLRLQSVKLKLHTYCSEEVFLTRIKAIYKNGVLCVNWGDVRCEFYHAFDGLNRYPPLYNDLKQTILHRRRSIHRSCATSEC
jgi:hypothetical protein